MTARVCTLRTGKLSDRDRAMLPDSSFGLIERVDGRRVRKYPMPDVSHAKNAKARAAGELTRGNLTRTEYATIVRKADAIITRCEGSPVRSNPHNPNPRDTAGTFGKVLIGLGVVGLVSAGAAYAWARTRRTRSMFDLLSTTNGEAQAGSTSVQLAAVGTSFDPFPPPLPPGGGKPGGISG